MSLINDMLTDLESRRANDLKRHGLKDEVRPLPRLDRSDGGRGWLVLAAVVVVLAIAAYYWWSARPASQPQAPLPAPAPAPVAATEIHTPVLAAPMLTAAGELDLRSATALAVVPPEAGSAPPALVPTTSTSLPVATTTTVASTSTTTQAARPQPAVSAAVLASSPAASASTSSAPAPASAKLPPKVAAESSGIDKRTVFASPRERLETEVRNAVQLANAGRSAEAAEQLRDILRQEPGLSAARQALLRILLELRRGDEMMAVLTEGLDTQPSQTGWAVSLARLWVERGDYTAAQRILARSYPHATANPEYLGFFAHVQYKQNNHREAAVLYQAAARQAPDEGRWWLGLGVALEADGRASEAREAYRRALATGSLNADLSALAEQKLR